MNNQKEQSKLYKYYNDILISLKAKSKQLRLASPINQKDIYTNELRIIMVKDFLYNIEKHSA